LSSWRWVLEAGSAPVEPLAARFFGGIGKSLSLVTLVRCIYRETEHQWTFDHPQHKQRVFHAPLTFVIAHHMSILKQG
jgi:hypothetical protein